MCCMVTTLVLLGPRLIGFTWWVLRPDQWGAVYSSFIVPAVGLFILPWTTMAYLLVAPGGLNGADWLWLGLAVVLDLASYSGSAYGNKSRIPRTTSSANMAKH